MLFTYDNNGHPKYNWQSHGATVVVNTTGEIESTYEDAQAGTVRPDGLVPPNEWEFAFDDGAGGSMPDARVATRDYDGLKRLIAFQRGELNARKDGITGTPVREEDRRLDMSGNWPGFVQKTSGSTDLDQGRTHNAVNEITAITATTGTDWADPVHDRAGNMTTIPKPANLADGLTATYDAWNRLVEVKDGQTVIAWYEYDGLNRRIKSHIDSGAPSNPAGIDSYVHYYYNSAWQILETRQSDTPSAQPESLQPRHQYVWSQRYIDAAVLRDENTGRELDPETGLYYYRNRYYSAELGRFVSRDLLGYEENTWNLLEYVSSTPLSWTDPMGLWRRPGESFSDCIVRYLVENGYLLAGEATLLYLGCVKCCASVAPFPPTVAACLAGCGGAVGFGHMIGIVMYCW